MSGDLTVIVADPHRATARAITQMLASQPGLAVVAQAEDQSSLVRLLKRHMPSVLVLDRAALRNQDLRQLALVAQASPHTEVLVVGMRSDGQWAREAQSRGAYGYLAKDSSPEDWVAVLQAMAEAAAGSSADTVVPLPGADSTVKTPPSSDTRSRIPSSPKPSSAAGSEKP
jgi:DNA-binding NarL/FixJ family response regulator